MDDGIDHRFAEFFQALWHKPPFAWQQALAGRVLGNTETPWPQAIALPTAAGKTACIDIALFALAAQAGRPGRGERITAPRRIFFVVDRRIIVDAAYDRARRIADELAAAKDGILKEVAGRLRTVAAGPGAAAGEPAQPLDVFELRGGMYRSEAWARSPLQPTVVASTVDQFGSRLLFRPYGRGPGMAPVYAGLTGNDSLVLLDEAHCAQPFLETLRAVARYRTWAEQPLPSGFHPVVLSATPPTETEADVFRDTSGQPRDPDHPLGRRQLAHKPAMLVPSNAAGKNAWKTLAKDLAGQALELASGPPKAIVVFANRVATARETFRLLGERCRKLPGDAEAILLTGRMRELDKQQLISGKLARLLSEDSETRVLRDPLFVVATQTLEVGADLDFDALVTECASLDALRQRFGRLNRMGRAIDGHDQDGHPIGARGIIVVRKDQADPGGDDPVYGAAIGHTWRALTRLATADTGGAVDFGIAHLDTDRLAGEAEGPVTPPADHAPVMLPAHIDCWVQTDPAPEPTPDVALFLHGPNRGTADVRVCWRADIVLDEPDAHAAGAVAANGLRAAIDALTLCPPAVSETVAVPIGFMRRWLAGETVDDSADIEGTSQAGDADQERREHRPRRVLRWRDRREPPRPIHLAADLRPGDVLVIPTATGGHKDLGDLPAPDDPAELDLGDHAYLQTRGKALLRLHPALVGAWPDSPARTATLALLEDAAPRFDEEPDDLAEDLRQVLGDIAEQFDGTTWQWLADAASHFQALPGRRLRRMLLRHPCGGLALAGSKRLPKYTGEADRFTDEDDASASGTTRVPLLPQDAAPDDALGAHLPGAAAFARRFAAGCQLDETLAGHLGTAGLLHDLGKADPRFQALLHGGNPWAPGILLAKSGDIPKGRTAYQRARRAAGYPEHGRHELLSVRLAEQADDRLLPPPGDPARDLILHLVASHHGHCRPFAPVVRDEADTSVEVTLNGQTLTYRGSTGLERLDSGISERFWKQVRRYGWWGSAWLEAMLRLADHRRSELEEST